MKIKVKKHKRRVKGRKVPVRKHRRNVKSRISKRKRKIFTAMARQPYEMGGQLDFEKGDLDNAKVYFGKKDEVEFPWDPDDELSFHTHISTIDSTHLPSYQDIVSMKETNEKEQIIFYKNIALSVAEDRKFARVSNDKIMNVSNRMQKDYEDGMTDIQLYNKYKPIFKRELGLDMTLHKPNVDIKLKTRSV